MVNSANKLIQLAHQHSGFTKKTFMFLVAGFKEMRVFAIFTDLFER